MSISFKYSFFLWGLVFLLVPFSTYSQKIRQTNHTNKKIELQFFHEKIWGSSDSLVFNPLVIKNNTDELLDCQIQITTPQNWQYLGEQDKQIKIFPNDSLIHPVSLIMPKNIKGDIGYVIIASLVTKEEYKTLQTASFYIKVPIESSIHFKLIDNIVHIDPQTNSTSLKYEITNKGNVDEMVSLKLTTPIDLMVKGESENVYIENMQIPWKTDTLINIDILSENVKKPKRLQSIKVEAETPHKKESHTLWVKHLKSITKKTIPDYYKCLSVRLSGYDILSNNEPSFSSLVRGNYLFKNGLDLYMKFQKYQNNFDLIRGSRYHLGIKNKKMDIYFGNVHNFEYQQAHGVGINGEFTFDKHKIRVVSNKNLITNTFNSGLSYQIFPKEYLNLNTDLAFKAGGFLSQHHSTQRQTENIFFQSFIKKAKHSLSTQYFLSKNYSLSDGNDSRNGYGLNILYSSTFADRLNINWRSFYGSPHFSGINQGRLRGKGVLNFKINKNNYFRTYYNIYTYQPKLFKGDSLLPQKYNQTQTIRSEYSYLLNPRLEIYAGPIYDFFKSNSFYYHQHDTLLVSKNPQLRIGTRIKGEKYFFLHSYLSFGHAYIQKASTIFRGEYNPEILNKTPLNILDFAATMRTKDMGIFINYYRGPYTPNETFLSLYLNEYYTQQLNVMPYIKTFIYKEKLELNGRFNFNYNIGSGSQRFYLLTRFRWHFTDNLLIFLSNNTSITGYTSSKGEHTSKAFSFTEIGIKKDFVCKQPRFEYSDLTLLFYKDLNGNRKRDTNEPGMKNVLVKAVRDSLMQYGNFNAVELISDQYGKIVFKNIPEGRYKFTCTPLSSDKNFRLENDTITLSLPAEKGIQEIPFYETFKLMGNIVMHRSPFSTLGIINLKNIKITAIDDQGNIYDTFTNRDGKFVFYLPSAGHYWVRINNIFKTHFNLQQEQYMVAFNGYKQFDISFVFNEKQRITQLDSYLEDDLEPEMVKQVVVSGTIKDGLNSEPVGASIEIIDKESGEVIKSEFSDANTGQYSVSFMSDGGNYSILINAEGYRELGEDLEIEQVSSRHEIKKSYYLKRK